MPNKPDELEQILQSYKGDTQAVDEDAVLRQYPEKLNQAHDDNLQEAKQAIQAHVDKRVNEVLDRVEAEAGWYSQQFNDQARKDNIEDTLIRLSSIKKLRSEL